MMIKISGLSKSYGKQLLLDNISFNINPKERIGLVGRNGHGKTTLFRILLGLEDYDEGQVILPKDYSLGYLEQHIKFSESTVLEEACTALPADAKHDVWKAEKILSGLGFKDIDFKQHPLDFSGGFQVRLNLAKVLIQDPDCLLLDEPTNYLDIISIRWLTQYLRQWRTELLLITHDRQFMDSVTTHTVGIHRQKVRKINGSTNKYFNQILQDEEIYEQTRLNDEKKRKETERFISRFRAKARLAGMVQSRIKSLEKSRKLDQLSKIEDLEFHFPHDHFPAKVMLDVQNLSFHYDQQKYLLIDKLNLLIGKKDRIAIIGKNGKGKTTLLKLLNEELSPTDGAIKKHPSLKCGYFGQTNIDRLNPLRTIEEELINTDPEHSRQRARDAAGVMMFSGNDAEKKISILSGGERSRVLLGKLLLSPAHLLLLDEPTNHLDLESCQALLEALNHYSGSVAMVTHDELFLHHMATKLVIFNQDQVFVYNGSYRRFLTEIGWDNLQASNLLTSVNQHQLNDNLDSELEEPSKSASNKKELRQEKAKLVQEKAKMLKPLTQKLEQLEKNIETREKELADNNNKLIEASISGDSDLLATLPQKNKALELQLDELYSFLTKLSQKLEDQAKVFDRKISTLETN